MRKLLKGHLISFLIVVCSITVTLLSPDSILAEDYSYQNSGNIKGHVYVTLGDGSSQNVRGEMIYLIVKANEYDDDKAAIDNITNSLPILANTALLDTSGSRFSFLVYSHAYMPRVIDKINQYFQESSFTNTRSTFEGEYYFENIPDGEYVLYARYKTNFNDAYWAVPIKVISGKTVEQDLASYNITDLKKILKLDNLKEAIDSTLRIRSSIYEQLLKIEIKVTKEANATEVAGIPSPKKILPKP